MTFSQEGDYSIQLTVICSTSLGVLTEACRWRGVFCLVAGDTGQAGVIIIFSAEFFRLQFHKRDKGRPRAPVSFFNVTLL